MQRLFLPPIVFSDFCLIDCSLCFVSPPFSLLCVAFLHSLSAFSTFPK